ncbi:MAG: mechanosensitive ion channel domain-containing protein [Candidatus Binatia bacterium]
MNEIAYSKAGACEFVASIRKTPRLKLLLRILLWGILAVCTEPTFAQSPAPGPASGNQAETTISKPVAVEPTADDAAIAKRIQRILESTGWFQTASILVQDGVVFIDGETDTQERWRWASALAQNTEGTVAVVNRIEVEADIGSTFGLASDEFVKIYRQAAQAWPWALVSAVIILFAWLLARLVAHFTRRFFNGRVSSSLLLNVVVRAISVPVFLLGLYFVLHIAGLTRLALTLLGGTGLIGIIIGFAFRDIAENFLASILLSVRNPFSSGDLIEIAGNTGVVKNLNSRSTVLLTLDGNYVQIPNAIVYKSIIKNFSSTASRRADFVVGISYESSTTKAQALIASVLKQHPAVLETPEPLVLVAELGAATVNLRIFYWYASATYSPVKINSALLRLTKDALLEGGIELPDPAREVVFPRGVPIVRMDQAKIATLGLPGGGHVHRDGETTSASIGEGDLRNDTTEVSARTTGRPPEAGENLLK